jgi:hypothetical protein
MTRKAGLKTFAICLSALCISGLVFEQIGEREDRRRYQQIGTSFDIGGRKLNIYCSGEGSPTVVFDTFGHMAGYSWSGVQREVAKLRRACWYDRAGYGWSDPAPMLRTFQSVATDLHALLHAASVPSPFVLVGAHDSALHIRVFYGMYPNEVAGIVMLNPNDVDDPTIEIPESEKGAWTKQFGSLAHSVRGAACVAYPILADTGLIRLARLFRKPRRTPSFGLTTKEQAELDFLSDNATAQRDSELCARDESMQQVRAAGDLGSVRLIVLASAGRSVRSTSAQILVGTDEYRNAVNAQRLAGLSSRSRIVFLDGDVGTDAIVRASRDITGEWTSTGREVGISDK